MIQEKDKKKKYTVCPYSFMNERPGGTLNSLITFDGIERLWPVSVSLFAIRLIYLCLCKQNARAKCKGISTFSDQQQQKLKLFDAAPATN
jgi:hypothetical protein